MDPQIREQLKAMRARVTALESAAESAMDPGERNRLAQEAKVLRERGKGLLATGETPSISDRARAGAQGLTAQWADEIEAGVRAPFSEQSYGEIRDQIRAQNESFSENFPSDYQASVAAGAAPWLAAPGLGWLRGATGVGGLMARSGLLGAAQGGGAAAGASESETLPGVALDTAPGAVMGGLMGAAAPVVPMLLSAGKYGVQSLFRNADDKADDLLLDQLKSQGFTPETLQTRMDQLGPEATLADVSPEMGGLLAATRQKGGTAGRRIDETIGARQAAGRDRMEGALRNVSGVREDVPSVVAGLQSQRRMFDEPLYRAATNQKVTVDEDILDALQSPAIRSEANQILKLNNTSVDDLELGDVVDLRVMDEIKKTVDKSIEQQLTDNLGRTVTEAAVPATQYQRRAQGRLVGALDEQVPVYNLARSHHRYFSEQLDPIQEGNRFYRQARDPQLQHDMLTEYYPGLGPDQQTRFRQGVMRDLVSDVRRSGGSAGTGLPFSRLGDPEVRGARFAGATGNDPASVGRLEDIVESESAFHDTFRMTSPNIGSKTAGVLGAAEQADEAAGIVSDVGRLAASGGADIMGVVERMRGIKGLSRPVADRIAERLTAGQVTPQFIESLRNQPDVPDSVFEMLQRYIRTTAGTTAAALSATGGGTSFFD